MEVLHCLGQIAIFIVVSSIAYDVYKHRQAIEDREET